MAVVVGVNGRPAPLHAEFEVIAGERKQIDKIISQLESVIDTSDEKKRRMVLAALAELSSRFMVDIDKSNEPPTQRVVS